jgi:hypothetical protein
MINIAVLMLLKPMPFDVLRACAYRAQLRKVMIEEKRQLK